MLAGARTTLLDRHGNSLLTYELEHSISCKIACTTSEISDQSAHPQRLIRVFVAFMSLATHSADVQADLSLRWSHMQCCRKRCEPAQMTCDIILTHPCVMYTS